MAWLTNVLILMAFCFSGILAVATCCYRPVVIVGGGPVGLTSALLLESLGFQDVTVLEQRDGKFDTERSYLYLIDRRGGKTFDALGLSHKLELRAVKSSEFTSLTEVRTDGSTNVLKLPVIPGGGEKYWVPRSVVIETLLEEIAQRPTIKIFFNASVDSIYPGRVPGGEMNNSLMVSGTGFSKINTEFLLGCDGQNSRVRDFLATSNPYEYEPVSLPSPSSGLHFKILNISPNFSLPGSGKSSGKSAVTVTREASNPTTGYAIRGIGKSSRSRLSLGLLPVQKGAPRTANVIAPADHDVWKHCTSLEATVEYFKKQFPQLQPPTDYFSVEELTRFATTKCGVFPRPAYTKKLTKTTYDREFTECNVALMGDSAHVFPPDLGQGINSGLEDAFVLAKCLARWKNRETSLFKYDQGLGFCATGDVGPFSIGNALKDFELDRLPEAKAIAEISTFAFPYQYNQGKWFMKTLALLNFGLRIALNRLSANHFLPPTFLLVQRDPPIKYTEILSMSTDSTRNIYRLFSILFTSSFLFARRTYILSLMETLSKAHFAFFGALSFIAFNTICLLRSEPGEAITHNRLISQINRSLLHQKVNWLFRNQ